MKQLFTLFVLSLASLSAFSQANTKLSNLASPTAVNQHLLPNSTNARDLGSSTYAWKSAYFRGYIYLDGTRFVSNAPGTGNYNAFVGSYAGYAVTSGSYNAALGHYALYKNTTGSYNTATGYSALYYNTNGYANTANGFQALYQNTTGYNNTGTGTYALYSNTTGILNTALGYQALNYNTGGSYNTAIGSQALYKNVPDANTASASNNTAVGYQALYSSTTGQSNTAVGTVSLRANTSGYQNVAIGIQALAGNTTGIANVAIGVVALDHNTTGHANTAIGPGANVTTGNLYNATAIGSEAMVDASNKVRIGNTTVISIGGQVNWTAFSDGRFKQNIKEDVHGMDFINSLRPITYTIDVKGLNAYNNKGRKVPAGDSSEALQAEEAKAAAEASKIIYNGFVAQEVELAAQKLQYSFSGVDKPRNSEGLYGLRYSDFVVPLVKAVQELDQKTQEENKQLKAEVDYLKEQLAKLETLLVGNTPTTTSAAYIEQNTPNPVNGATTIRYHIPETAVSAMLSITNAKGQLVKTISISSKGTGQIGLNTNMLASGTYNYTLFVDGTTVDTKRIIVTR